MSNEGFIQPPNHSPVEVTNVYERKAGSSNTGKFFGVWDHSGIYSNDWIIYKPIDDPTFKNTYTATYTDGRFYFFQILKTSSSSDLYTVLLYNFQTQQWEHQSGGGGINFPLSFSGAGTVAQATGWGFHEPKFDDICPDLQPIKLSGLKVWNGSTWFNNTIANGASEIDGGLWCSGAWGDKELVHNDYEWTVNF